MKYHPLELQDMAVQFLMHQVNNDPRCDELLARMSEKFGITSDEVFARIHSLAMLQAA